MKLNLRKSMSIILFVIFAGLLFVGIGITNYQKKQKDNIEKALRFELKKSGKSYDAIIDSVKAF